MTMYNSNLVNSLNVEHRESYYETVCFSDLSLKFTYVLLENDEI